MPHAFANFDNAADEAFYLWLVKQNNEWWSRDPAEVNAEIKAKVEELRRPEPPGEAELEQAPKALKFKGNERLQVSLSDETAQDKISLDQETKDRHKSARQAAQAVIEASQRGLTQATDIVGLTEAYMNALGKQVSQVKASNLVTFGAFLRDQIRRRDVSSKPPFSESQADALEQWRFVHNLFVAADPYLSSLERLASDPEDKAATLPPDEGKAIVEDGRSTAALDDSAADGLVIVADAVFQVAEPDNPQSQTWMDSIRNSIRSAASIIKANPIKSAAAGAGGAGGGAYKLAEWVQRHYDTLMRVFADEPSMLAIIKWIPATTMFFGCVGAD